MTRHDATSSDAAGSSTGRRIMACAVVLLLCACLGSCGSSSAPSGSAGGQHTSRSGAPAITSVLFHRDGGLKPMQVDKTFVPGGPPPAGSTPRQAGDVLAAARRFVASGESIRPTKPNACCDRFSYTITITFEDGSMQSYRTIDGAKQPPLFEALLASAS